MSIIIDEQSGFEPDPYELALSDGAGCLSYLLAAPTREGVSVGHLCQRADKVRLADRTLRTLGIAMKPEGQWATFAVAAAHPALAHIFASSVWIGEWSTALMTLHDARRGARMLFGRCYSAAIILPRSLLLAEFER